MLISGRRWAVGSVSRLMSYVRQLTCVRWLTLVCAGLQAVRSRKCVVLLWPRGFLVGLLKLLVSTRLRVKVGLIAVSVKVVVSWTVR